MSLPLAILLALVIFFAVLVGNFKPSKTTAVAEGVYAVWGLISNFYIVEVGSGQLIAIDTGLSPAFARKGFTELGLSLENVTDVFLTHSDFDHAGALSAFPNAKRHISELEAPLASGKQPRRLFVYNHRIPSLTLHKNANEIAVGNSTVRMISTPGHTPGSACWLVNGSLLFTGDLLRINKDLITPFMAFMDMDHSRSVMSLALLKRTAEFSNAKYILTGHSGFIRAGSIRANAT